MAEDSPKYTPKFERPVDSVVVGEKNIIHNYFYYREDVRGKPVESEETAAEEKLRCPYRGLFHFGPNDAEFFFGREVFVEELFQATQTRNFISVLGASGSGKSSVVLAGLVPKLQQEGHWKFTHFRPGSDPFHALAEALVPLYEPEKNATEQMYEARQLAEYFVDGSVSLRDVFAQIERNYHNAHARLLLIADQFEELYTLCRDEKIRRSFLDTLLGSFQSPCSNFQSPPVLVITMRADFLGNALSYRPFADVLQNDLKLGPMNHDELREVIEQPAQKLKVTFEEGLVERILNDVEDQPGNLPLLEFALTELWNQRTGKQLTHKIYEEIGQVEGALARHADEKYGNLTDEEKDKVRRIFIQLVRPGEGTEDTRRIAVKGELGEQSWSLVKRLADARLVITSRNAMAQETVELVHEALIHNWGELREWMSTDRVFRAWQERLRAAMTQWEATKKDRDSLLRGAALAEAKEKLTERPEDLISEKAFIQQSIQERERLEKEKEARRRRESRTFWGLACLLAVLLLLFPLAIFTWRQWIEAAKQSVNANYNFSKFLSLDEQSLEALVAAVKAGQQVKKVANLRNSDAEIWAVSALRQELYSKRWFRELNRLEGHNQPVRSVNFSPDGQVLVTSSNETVNLWQRDGTLLQTFEKNSKVSFSPDTQLIVFTSKDAVKLWRRDGTLLKSFDKNSKVSFSPDSQLIVSISENILEVWNRDGSLLDRLKGHHSQITSVNFSPDSQLIVSTSEDAVQLWRRDGTLLKSFDKNSKLSFSPDSQLIFVSTSRDAEIKNKISKDAGKLWRRDGTLVQTFDKNSKVSFSPDTQLIVFTSKDAVKLWRRDGTLLKSFDKNSKVSFSPDSQLIVSISENILEVWNRDGSLLDRLKGHHSQITSVNFSPDSQLIVSTSEDAVQLWRRDGTLVQTFDKNSKLSFSPDSQLIVSISENILEVWNRDGSLLDRLKGHHSQITSVNFSPDSKMIASTAWKTVKLWLLDDKFLKFLEGHGSNVTSVSFSPDAKIIASTGNDKTVKLWHSDGTLLQTLDGHKSWVLSANFSPDGQILASASADRTVKLWHRDGKLFKLFKTLEGHKNGILSVSFSPDGQILASASADRTVKLWHRDGTLFKTLEGHGNEVSSIDFSPDSKIIATASWDGTVKLWHRDGTLFKTLEGYGNEVLSVSFSPDGKIIATASWDGTVKLWHRDGKLFKTLEGHGNEVLSVSFSPDGKIIASASADNTVRLWHRRNSNLLNTLEQHRDWVRSVSFSPDGQTIASASEDGTIILWNYSNLDELLRQTCNWLDDYLNVSKEDSQICDGVPFKDK